jgi:hypothetical protein
MTTRVIFKAEDQPIRQSQEQVFTVDGVQYVDVLVESVPTDKVVGKMDEAGVWAVKPAFEVPHAFAGWEEKPADQDAGLKDGGK